LGGRVDEGCTACALLLFTCSGQTSSLACSGPNAIRSVETTRVPLAAKAAVPPLIGTDGPQGVNLSQYPPQHIRKVELTVHALANAKARQADLDPRSDDSVGVG